MYNNMSDMKVLDRRRGAPCLVWVASQQVWVVVHQHQRHNLVEQCLKYEYMSDCWKEYEESIPFYMSDDNSHSSVIELVPHFDELGEFSCWVRNVQSSRANIASLK